MRNNKQTIEENAMKTITMKAINGYYYDVFVDYEDIYNHNITREKFNNFEQENITKLLLDDHAVHIETNAIYFTIDLDSASMLLTEDHELEKENLQRMGNPPVVIRSTEGEPTQMWKDINEITQDFYTTDDPDDCDFISSGEMFLIDDEYNRDEILNIVKEYV